MDKVFNNKFSDKRKKWLENYNPENVVIDEGNKKITPMDISNYIDEFINIRS